MSKGKYPECEKLAAVSEDSNKIGAFLDWMRNEKELVIGRRHSVEVLHEIEQQEDPDGYGTDYGDLEEVIMPVSVRIEKMLADYYDIDLDKVEDERRAMLDEIKNKNAKEIHKD